ncbi:tail protein X [Aliiroseovarius crassostreae]|uniref:tail protein X n=1 Tax=Aliiroseovarius crassostreae TaxID=154981 RepID=UPI0022036397|nr:tail protein X [Aliiroseovarius crassostreae]UWQ00863.1 tail protein X [Aliiroseovarius crassostreae]
MKIYRTIDGDMVDTICKSQYGREDMAVAVYEANPGLAARGPILPKGIEIRLPDAPTAPVRTPVRLWS